MKVIFLDFDGVICTGRQALASGERGVISGLDPVALGFLNRICRDHKIRIVISSTWRMCGKKNRRSFYELFACDGYVDLGRAIHDDWRTPNLPDATRGHEIEFWLSDNGCDDYVILDDDSDMLEYQKPRMVTTDSHNGMLFEHYKRVMELLEIPV